MAANANAIVRPEQRQSLEEDTAHLLSSRSVLQLLSEDGTVGVSKDKCINALQPLLCNSLQGLIKKPTLSYILDDQGSVVADLFVIWRDEHQMLLDVERCAVPMLLPRIKSVCHPMRVKVRDVSDQWRVFAELPNQTTFDDGSDYIKFSDPRWHMGNRVLRPRGELQSTQWGHEYRWQTHAFKLGFFTSASVVDGQNISAVECNLHTQGVLEDGRVPAQLLDVMACPAEKIERRVLPMRVEPSGTSLPTMTGAPILAGLGEAQESIATVLAHIGLYGLALVDIAEWRSAIQQGMNLHCADQPVLITWPTWLAKESRGRAGPTGQQF